MSYVYVYYGRGLTGAIGVSTLVTVPALWVGNGALVAWMVRLLVLYDPGKRKSWGRYVNERRVARILCWVYTGAEAAFWIGVAVHGMERCMSAHSLTSGVSTFCTRFNR